MEKKDIQDLLKKAQTEKLSPAEEAQLEYWLHHLNEEGNPGLTDDDLLNARQSMWAAIENAETNQPVHHVINWKRYVAAASLVLLSGTILVYSLKTFYKADPKSDLSANNIAPGGNKAILTLGNGKQIVLAETGHGQLSKNAQVSIVKSDDSTVVYGASANQNIPAPAADNILTTPKGGQYSLVLADGTKVILNAASTLSFPERFTGTERRVKLIGEAYFEVAHNAQMPFHVESKGQDVQVLGTHFDINAYPDEPAVKTTLLEGKVKINDDVVLQPGEQAVFQGDFKVSHVNVDDVVAWKNGYFRFDDDNLEGIMKILSRWYNVKYVFKDEELKKLNFGAVTNRFANINKILNLMETAGLAHFQIDNDTIIISKKTNQN